MSIKLSKAKRERILSKTQYRCGYCGAELIDDTPNFDHIIAKSNGGDNSEENILAACRFCNSSKSTKHIEEFRLYVALNSHCENVRFSSKQIKWLEKMGVISFLFGRDYRHLFYFERLAVQEDI